MMMMDISLIALTSDGVAVVLLERCTDHVSPGEKACHGLSIDFE